MERMRITRIARKMTQKDVADKLGVDRTTYVKYETGASSPSLTHLSRIADMFGVTADFLMDRPEYNGPVRVPVLGTIPAGIPLEAIQDIVDYEELPAYMTQGGQEYFGLAVSGNSMEPEYRAGDVIILRRQDTCESGQDCAVMINGDDATFKRVRLSADGLTLQPLNPSYDPIHFSQKEVEERPVRILGVVVELRRKI